MVGIEYLGATYAETEQRVQRNLNQVVVFLNYPILSFKQHLYNPV